MKPELGTENAKEAVGGVRVTRREFWDIFTDYTVLKGDTWLSLPLSVFSIFEDQDSGTVDVLEVFLMVALFSEGSMEEQLRFCFRAFDTDQSGAITLDEMVHFFKVLCRASFKVRAHVPVCAAWKCVKHLMWTCSSPSISSRPASPHHPMGNQ